MTVHLISYVANGSTEQRIARVRSNRRRPTWSECHDQLDGFIGNGKYLGVEPQYTLTYASPDGPVTRTLSGAKTVERMGTLVSRAANRGEAWDIEVIDEKGQDVTFNFACFRD